ncbi:MAG TPA: acyloxyacyl hydrolase [Sphingomicrobium sp.]|nr:acyloxyacyl hydrolase [Sphingomicrobium sp.]
MALTQPTAASAGEIFGGLYVHGVDTPLTLGGDPEDGVDFQLGWRGGRIGNTPLQPYLFGSVNSAGETHFAAAGISAKFGDRIYVRPGLGLAVHTGSADRFDDPFNDEIEFGSRILFAPEVGIGFRIAPRVTAEASWVHFSHATLFSGQNPGIDTIGVRVNVALP